MAKELEGKVGLVTGGTSGIGRETAVLFAKAGAKVVVAGRREIEGNETIELVRAAGGDGLFVKTDVSKASEVEALIQKTAGKFGRLDIAFNNAGIEVFGYPSSDNQKRTGIAPLTLISRACGSASSLKFGRCSNRAVAGLS